MRVISRLRFRSKLILGITAIVVCTTLGLTPLVARMTATALLDESKKRGAALAESLAARAVDPLLSGDLLRLKNMVDEAEDLGEEVVYAFILDQTGYVLAQTFQGGFPVDLLAANRAGPDAKARIQLLESDQGRIDDFAASVRVGGADFGEVRLGLSRKPIQGRVNRLILTMGTLSAGGLALAIALSTVFANKVTSRIGRLREHAEDMVKGDLDLHSAPPAKRNCWEIMDCGLKACPAYGDTDRRCWYLAGTQCPQCRSGEESAGRDSCRNCPVYRENAGDEIQDLAETFDAMALSLKAYIGELKEAERVLSNQERLMRTILNVTPDLVSLVDTRMVYQAANTAFAAFVQRDVRDIRGKTDFDIFPEHQAEQRHLESRDILATGRRLDRQDWIDSPQGPRWFHTVSIPVRDQEGGITGLLRTDRDLTDLKRYQEQLIQSQKMESVGKLAGGVAHEINTPLGVVLGYAQLLMEDVEEGSQMHQDLATIAKQAKVCRKIVADLLGFSRQAESEKREMCFNNSVMEAVSLVRHTFEMDKVTIEERLDDRMPIIYGDPEKLKQVWINLLNNARDAMASGGKIVVKTVLDTPAQKVTLWLADTGTGIGKEDIRQIFDPFFTTKPVGKGTGLGLSVSFGIIEDHGGEIHVESPAPEEFAISDSSGTGPGTVFIVDLPLDHESMVEAGSPAIKDEMEATPATTEGG
ncbi:PAS domain S-box-containing protein [Paucidesulfovibrio gracilis DSM 16080]|uniref:histidine kinase n=1 Tax=Paucidesulfovibrio gracilis DSM 16080 TaxID=1121449 RepID=A0A1T4WXE9_9BACT|nr:ATP-binding protein [Paucidesulfovibrio gracilis]SKA81817.1 PAS domain S-box-containing protein [Paucidesulfovibrio gracilis DSM 16080]